MSKWILPTLSEVVAQGEQSTATPQYRSGVGRRKAERQWCGAIAALVAILEQTTRSEVMAQTPKTERTSCLSPVQGLILSGPLPVLSHSELMSHYASWLFSTDGFYADGGMPFQLPPADNHQTGTQTEGLSAVKSANWLSLSAVDPLKTELFCLALTTSFSLVLVWSEDEAGEARFQFSFDPTVVENCWQTLRSRVALKGSLEQLHALDTDYEQFAPREPNYKTVAQFSQALLHFLPEEGTHKGSVSTTPVSQTQPPDVKQRVIDSSVELLSAIAHEVKTPLTTIRTLTRLLLKRRDLPEIVLDRLKSIDRECTEQIDRFGLIFRAVEIETNKNDESESRNHSCGNRTNPLEKGRTSRAPVQLTPTSLSQVFQQSIPRWQKQAGRRNLTLDVALPQKMPAVVSDPTLLDQVLTGLIENFTCSLPTGSHVTVEVTPAGSQLKLQFQSQPQAADQKKGAKIHCNSSNAFASNNEKAPDSHKPTLKSLGQLLMFQPETGHLSLNMSVTKNLFQAIGGKLIVRHRPQQGQVLTIFLPLNIKEI